MAARRLAGRGQQRVDRLGDLVGDLRTQPQRDEQLACAVGIAGGQFAAQIGNDPELPLAAQVGRTADLLLQVNEVAHRYRRPLWQLLGRLYGRQAGQPARQRDHRRAAGGFVAHPVGLRDRLDEHSRALRLNADRKERDPERCGPLGFGLTGLRGPEGVGEDRDEAFGGLDLIQQRVPPALTADQVVVVEGGVAQLVQVYDKRVDNRPIGAGITDEDIAQRLPHGAPSIARRLGVQPIIRTSRYPAESRHRSEQS
jgi:hypothetical protein